MKQTEKLRAIQSRRRTFLMVSLLMFLTAFFALVSGWPAAYALIAASCLFYLISSHMLSRRYRLEWVRTVMEKAAESQFTDVQYQDSEPSDGFWEQSGLTPPLSFASGARHRFVLHARRGGIRYTLGETSGIRMENRRVTGNLAGTFVRAEGILPKEERWLILCDDAMYPLCGEDEYPSNGFMQAEQDRLSEKARLFLLADSTEYRQDIVSAVLEELDGEGRMAAAAADGILTLFIPKEFFAPVQVDISVAFDEKMLKGCKLKRLDQMIRITEQVRNQMQHDGKEKDEGK